MTIREEVETLLQSKQRQSESDADYVKRLMLAFNDTTTVSKDQWYTLSESAQAFINDNLELLPDKKPMKLFDGMKGDVDVKENEAPERDTKAESENEGREAAASTAKDDRTGGAKGSGEPYGSDRRSGTAKNRKATKRSGDKRGKPAATRVKRAVAPSKSGARKPAKRGKVKGKRR